MTDRVLTEQIKSLVLNSGMDLVGFAPVSRWKNAPLLLSPPAILPTARTVVVSAIHITDTWTEMGGEPEPQDRGPGGWMDQNSLMDRVAYRLARYLNDQGHEAIAVVSSNIWRYRAFEGIPSLFAPDLSHIHAATAAGLAEIGWCGLAITPEFGARCRFITVVTNAELTPTPMYSGPKLCDMCMECVRHCPTAALTKELQEPHQVEIGGKVFKYANKNIWRCAWAEHFNLDLKSENLKRMDTVGEKEVLAELNQHGIRGHERGVCQKVCVPPHLRTREPSFGRNRLIAQNRINKRYPENMPTLRKMRDDIIAYAVRQGVDVALVGPLDDTSPTAAYVNTQAPGMRTVFGFAMRMPPEARQSEALGSFVNTPYQMGFYRLMHHVLLRTARMVEDYGYHAASYAGNFTASDDTIRTAMELAQMVGLGTMNEEGVFESAEFGSDVIVGAVTTDALVDATPAAKSAPAAFTPQPKITGAKLKQALAARAEQNLVSLFGVTPPARLQQTVADLKANLNEAELGEEVVDVGLGYHGEFKPKVVRRAEAFRGPQDYLPEARSIIVMGMHFPACLIDNSGLDTTKQIGTYAFHQFQTHHELCYAACDLTRMLSAMGYRSVITQNLLGVGSWLDTPRGRLADARCNAIEAVAAGLGELGRHGSLLTPQYGPHQRCIAIITDAELPADNLYDGTPLCRDCDQCAQTCPMDALNNDETVSLRVDGRTIAYPVFSRHRCDWSKRYSLNKEEGPVLIGNQTHVMPSKSGPVTIEELAEACRHKDPIMKSRTCILETCLRHCPAGGQ